MIYEATLKRKRDFKPVVIYVHVEPCEEDQWYCTFSVRKPFFTKRLGRFYHRPPRGRDNREAVLAKYLKYIVKYYSNYDVYTNN